MKSLRVTFPPRKVTRRLFGSFPAVYSKSMRKLVSSLVPALLLVCDAALAQQGTGPPQPDLRQGAPQWVGLAVIFLLTAVVMAVSLMPSKRGHQD